VVSLGAVLVVGSGVVLISPAPAPAEKAKVTVERVDYRGWKNNLRLGNGDTELIVTLDVGPRILSYRLQGGRNVFKEYQDQLGGSGEPEWMIRGGHRLWASPEDPARTYAPDNARSPIARSSRASSGSPPRPRRPPGFRKRSTCGYPPRGRA